MTKRKVEKGDCTRRSTHRTFGYSDEDKCTRSSGKIFSVMASRSPVACKVELTKSVVNDVDEEEESAGSLPEGSNENSWSHISDNKHKEEGSGSSLDDSKDTSICDKVKLTTATRSRKNDAVGLSFIFSLAPDRKERDEQIISKEEIIFRPYDPDKDDESSTCSIPNRYDKMQKA
mmetsp:Transcript_14757/g.21790  ORF Transcript_14757/g.21790 Transcript_14757/m.21790 type:complete len:175 (-) Transcript_14757:294-818(-)